MSIRLYRGDNPDFADQRNLLITLTSEFSLAGFTAEFQLQKSVKRFADLSGGVLEVILSASETFAMNVGRCFGTLRLIDPANRIKTLTTHIPFLVTGNVDAEEVNEYSVVCTIEDGTVTVDVSLDFGTVPEAPVDGKTYIRKDGEWAALELVTAGSETFNVIGYTELKTLDLSDCTNAELIDLVGSLISALKTVGVIK